LIGEDVEFITILAEEVNNIIIDPGQFEQVVMNIVINARDAMPHGGTLKIITQNYTVHAPNKTLSQRDSSRGIRSVGYQRYWLCMDKETQEKIFEPFFTTKGQTTGTGLGLATVYGIVRQSGGYIWMSSERERGQNSICCFLCATKSLLTTLKQMMMP
jgi:signal transduction histidine kinase